MQHLKKSPENDKNFDKGGKGKKKIIQPKFKKKKFTTAGDSPKPY
jgi:hypothetical protein